MKIVFALENVVQEGGYTIKGQVLVLPIAGSGKCTIVWQGLKMTLDMDLKETVKNGVNCYQITKMPVYIDPKKVFCNFENLFNGNKALGDNMNRFLNDNWMEILIELKPAISKAMELGYMEYINRILSKIPVKEVNIK